MTSSILFWLSAGVIALLAYTVFILIFKALRRKSFIPRNGKEWKDFIGDFFTLFAAIFILIVLETNYRNPMQSLLQYRDKPITEFSFYNINTSRQEWLRQYKGKLVLLNIWATWCGPCRKEMPELGRLHKEYRDSNVVVIAISDEGIHTIKEYLGKNPVELITGNFGQNNSFLATISTRPVSILIDQRGKLQEVVVGSRGYNFFKGWMEQYLK
jgi:thiol-disulfide isomerase/thioredoxin